MKRPDATRRATAAAGEARAGRRDAVAVPGAARATCTLSVGGMDCASCAASVERSLRALGGVEDVSVDLVGGRVVVAYAEGSLARSDLVGAVGRAGYRVADEAPGPRALPTGAARVDPGEWRRRVRLAPVVVSGVLWVLALAAGRLPAADTAAAVLALGAVVSGGWTIVPRGVRAALRGALDMNFLMSVAAVGAVAIGEYREAASAMFLFAVAQLLEARSMDRARNAIRALMDLSPAQATVLRAGAEARVPVDAVGVGETVVVRPGEKIPVDGEVVAGESGVDQAPITGESLPVEKGPGAAVYAGTLNGQGVLEIRSSRPAADTTLARIIHSVEEAQASRAPSQTFVDRFARVYTPAVVLAAVLVCVAPPLVGSGAWGEWFYRALVLLVVACPCALVISTPVTIVSALAGAAREGILIKGGLHLESAGRARIVALDKTGTLTEARPAVVDVAALDGGAAGEVLALAAAAEQRSGHPLARAIVRRAERDGIVIRPAADAVAVTGKGHRARVGDEDVWVGGERLLEELGVDRRPLRAVLDGCEADGRTAVVVATRRAGAAESLPRVRGVIAISDRVRATAVPALRALHAAGIERVVMLTGDNPGTARAVAEALGGPGAGVDEYRAGLLPADKVAAVHELRARHERVLFVGDGVNDAPALASADVGVAMGSAGTDVALETADIALMADDLSKLPVAIRLARKAERIIRANIGFALLTKVAFVALALAGYATLWMAVLADMGTSLLVVANGLRALRT